MTPFSLSLSFSQFFSGSAHLFQLHKTASMQTVTGGNWQLLRHASQRRGLRTVANIAFHSHVARVDVMLLFVSSRTSPLGLVGRWQDRPSTDRRRSTLSFTFLPLNTAVFYYYIFKNQLKIAFRMHEKERNRTKQRLFDIEFCRVGNFGDPKKCEFS